MPTPEEQAQFNALVEKLNKEPIATANAEPKAAKPRSSVEDYFKGSYGPVTERLDARTEASIQANCNLDQVKKDLLSAGVSTSGESVSHAAANCVAKVKEVSGQSR